MDILCFVLAAGCAGVTYYTKRSGPWDMFSKVPLALGVYYLIFAIFYLIRG